MKLEDVTPAHCHARAQRLFAEIELLRDELGRTKDGRPAPEVSGAAPREVYFEAIAAWHKADRLAHEVGGCSGVAAPAIPNLRELRPGHCLQLIDGVLAQILEIKKHLHITEVAKEPAVEASRQPSDVLVTLVRINRELSRSLERPFTPSDVYRTVALAATYAYGLGATTELPPFERKRKPADCYARLEGCLAAAGDQITKRGETALHVRGTPADIQPTDVYDLANLVLGEVAFLHALVPSAKPVPAFGLGNHEHRLPAHVHQLARTLETQLTSLK